MKYTYCEIFTRCMSYGVRETPVAMYYTHAKIEKFMYGVFSVSVHAMPLAKQRLNKIFPTNTQQYRVAIAVRWTCFLHFLTRGCTTRYRGRLERIVHRISGSLQSKGDIKKGYETAPRKLGVRFEDLGWSVVTLFVVCFSGTSCVSFKNPVPGKGS
jgi:hypothetical protein